MALNPAAWRPDPSKRFRLRWWNGRRWTEWVADDSGETSIDRISDAQSLSYIASEKLSRLKRFRGGVGRADTVENERDYPESKLPAPTPDFAPDLGAGTQLESQSSLDSSLTAVYEKCEALFPRPRIPQEKVEAMVEARSLKELVDTPPAGWSKSRQPPKAGRLPALKYSEPKDVRTVSQLVTQLKIWDQELARHRHVTQQKRVEWERKAKKWEEIVIELWRQSLIADAVLEATPHPSNALKGQHSRIKNRLINAPLPTESVRTTLQRFKVPPPALNSSGLESVLRDATMRLNFTQSYWKLNVDEPTKADDAIASIDEKILQVKTASSEQKFELPEVAAVAVERPESWPQWLSGVRKYLKKFGPEGPLRQISPDELDQLEEHVHEVLNSWWSEFEAHETELKTVDIKNCRDVFPYLESVVAHSNHESSPEVAGMIERYQKQLAEIQKYDAELNTVRKLVERETKRFHAELASLKKQGRELGTVYLDDSDSPWEIYNLLKATSSSKFEQQYKRVQDAASRYHARLEVKRIRDERSKKAKEIADRKELSNVKRSATMLQKKIEGLRAELRALEKNSAGRESAKKAAEKKLRRLQEDLRDAKHEPLERRRRLEKSISRVQEDLSELLDDQKRAQAVSAEVSSLEIKLKDARARIEATESARRASQSKPGSKRGNEPVIGFVDNSHDFEQFLARWMHWVGWSDAEAVPVGPDGGVDVRAKGAIGQAKYWDKPVGIEEVQRHMGVTHKLKPVGRIFLSKNGYTPQAIEFAEQEGMVLLEMKSERGSARAVGVTSLAKQIIKGS